MFRRKKDHYSDSPAKMATDSNGGKLADSLEKSADLQMTGGDVTPTCFVTPPQDDESDDSPGRSGSGPVRYRLYTNPDKTNFHNLNKKEILKEIFSLPKEKPEMSMKNQLQRPMTILEEFLPLIFKYLEWTAIFFLGYFGASYSWIITLILLYWARHHSRPKIKSSSDEEGFLIDALPSWVVFPDVERAQWVNVILKKVWPHVGEISRQIAKRLVEPKIKEILNRLNLEGLSNFKLKNFILGTVPATVGGIKVYDSNTSRDEIVMDIDIVYQGDACANFTVQNFECEINQIYFRGVVRATIKPLLDCMPLIGGVELYFMQMPEYDYNLGKMAGLAEIPGISNLIRSTVDSIIRRGFVWPNRFNFFFPIESVQRLQDQTFAMPAPQGILKVHVLEARDLVKKDRPLIGGKSDPYVVLSIGEKKISFRDKYLESTVNPVWNYLAEFPIEEDAGLTLKLEVFDYDAGSEDDFLGRTCIPVSAFVHANPAPVQVQQSGPRDSDKATVIEVPVYKQWIQLEDTKHGEVKLRTEWWEVTEASLASGSLCSYVVAVYVESCTGLSSSKNSGSLFSRVVLRLASSSPENMVARPLSRKESKKLIQSESYETFTTKPRGPSADPRFQEGYFFLSNNPKVDTVSVQVVEQGSNKHLGSTNIKVSYLESLPGKQFSKMPWQLDSSAQAGAAITLTAKLYAF